MSTISKYFAPVPASDNAACEGTGASKKRKRDALHIDQVTGSGTPASKPLVPDISETRTLPDLQEEWRVLYSQTLPSAARRKDPAQTKWPVTLDHCFARIILDSAVGIDAPWTERLKSPAIRHMSRAQLEHAITLGRKILDGTADLVALDEKSLALRGKRSKAVKKQKTEDHSSSLSSPKSNEEHGSDNLITLIESSGKTDFQKRCLKALLQIPSGQFSTYAALAKYLESSPRAVGNAMRGNPFAPRVPCHRILAADRSIGGFGGEWGNAGKHVNEKLELLRGEGVKFDSKGKVLGPVFTGYR